MNARVALSFVVIAVVAAPAAAEARTYAGGLLPSWGAKGYRPHVGITLEPQGRSVALRFHTSLKCGREFLEIRDLALRPLRSGRVRARVNGVSYSGERLETRVRWSLSARVGPRLARGTLTIRGRRTKGRRQRCRARPKRRFTARLVTPPQGAPAAPRRGGTYLGLARNKVVRSYRGAVVVRVAPGGRQAYGIWEARAPCRRGGPEVFGNFTPPTRIKPDHSFRRNERFRIRYSDAVVRYRVSFGGRFTTDGVRGTLRLRARIYDRRGRLRTTCDSGVRPWTALLP